MDCSDCGVALPAEARFCLQCGARVQPTSDAVADPLRDALERAIGFQYRIERPLGRGGMGAVYLAHEFALDRDVAIKVLPPEQGGTPQSRARFKREARTAARLSHPNIVPLHTFGEVDGLMYFVMGYVSGESLASRLSREGALGSEATRTLLADLTDALEYAHRHGIVHRDLKPDNILIDDESGAPLLTDFGIAKAPLGDGELTTTGQIMGTPHYMSPEQALGQADVDARSDLYSLGVVAYEMVSGRLPFDAKSPLDALTQRLTQDPRPLRVVAPAAADDLLLAITRCLEREPARRWPDVKSLRAALVATDDDSEDALLARLLRLCTAFVPILLIAAGYLAAFGGPRSAVGSLAGVVAPLLILIAGAVVVLKRQKLDMRAILQVMLRQPRWWRFWYPKRFRRPGDVWDRLPPRIRRVRTLFALMFCLMLGVYMPVQMGLLFAGKLPGVRTMLSIAVLALMALLFFERSRTTKYVATTLGLTPLEASKILSTPSWRASVWQRGAASALLRPTATTGARRPPADTARPAAVAAKVDQSDDVTRLS
jgi:hypothetical protein